MITLTSVTKKYGPLTAVDNVSFTVTRGNYFALLGPNGAGKTTLIRLLLGFSKPSNGNLSIDGKAAGTPLSRKKIGYLAENHKIPAGLKGKEYLSRHAALIGLGRAAACKEIARVLDIVGMRESENKRATTYSKGMTQRMGLAAAILGDPRILILDEPTSGLDPMGIRDFRVILEQLRHNNVTLILNSHFLSEVEKVCDTVAIMHQGKILQKGTIDAIVEPQERLEDVFVRMIEGTHA